MWRTLYNGLELMLSPDFWFPRFLVFPPANPSIFTLKIFFYPDRFKFGDLLETLIEFSSYTLYSTDYDNYVLYSYSIHQLTLPPTQTQAGGASGLSGPPVKGGATMGPRLVTGTAPGGVRGTLVRGRTMRRGSVSMTTVIVSVSMSADGSESNCV